MEKVVEIDCNKIKNHAKANRWSYRRLALVTGISPSGVHKMLTGVGEPSAVNLKKVCDTLGLPIEQVFIEKKAA